MFCSNCGAQIPDGSTSCSSCGVETEAGKASSGNAGIDISATVQKARSSKYFIPVIAGIALILVIVLVVSLFGGSGKTKPIGTLMDAMEKADAKKLMAVFPDAYYEYLDEEGYQDIDDLEDDLEDVLKDVQDEYEDEYGKNIKLSFEVTDEDELSERKLDELADTLKDYYGLSKRDLTEAWELECELLISGSDDDDSEEMTFTVIKYDGKWYISPQFFGSFS